MPRPATPPPRPAIPPARPHVLVVDSDDDVRAYLCQLLRGDGCAVIDSPTIAGANRHLRAHRSTVVVTELVVSGQELTGRVFLRELRDYDPLLPVIVCTGLPWTRERDAQVREVAAAGTAWLPKTYPDAAMLPLVQDAHRRYVEAAYPRPGGAGIGHAPGALG